MRKFFLVAAIAATMLPVNAFAAPACPGKSVVGKVTRTVVPHYSVVVIHRPISRLASKELADRTMGTVYEVGDTSPVPQPPSSATTRVFARNVAKDLGIQVCRIR